VSEFLSINSYLETARSTTTILRIMLIYFTDKVKLNFVRIQEAIVFSSVIKCDVNCKDSHLEATNTLILDLEAFDNLNNSW